MVTNKSWNSEDPAQVSKGGTGNSTLTDHAVLVGSGTSPVTPLAVANEGELLVGASTADPAFGTSADGNFTFTSSTAAAKRSLSVANTDNTSGTSDAELLISTGGVVSGDPSVRFEIAGTQTYSLGIDNSSFDELVITDNTSHSGGSRFLEMSTAGIMNLPKTVSFSALQSATINNVTGDGTVFTIISNTVLFDQSGDYDNTTGIFTAPVAGRYMIGGRATIFDAKLAGSDIAQYAMSATSGIIEMFKWEPSVVESADGRQQFSNTIMIDMAAADTVKFIINIQGGAKTVDVIGGGSDVTGFWGYLQA